MYFNPAMASGHTLGCGTTPYWEHFAVYWCGPFIGCYLATVLDRLLHIDVRTAPTPPPAAAAALGAEKKKKKRE
jgi:hypothetical protein